MYYEQLAFANRQLAGLLKSGIPLEEGLQKFARDLNDRKLVGQFDALEKQLAQGVTLPRALENSTFPPFYKKLVSLGCHSNDLPEVLLMVADHYEKTAGLRLQLRGMMVYPTIVIVGAMIVSLGVQCIFSFLSKNLLDNEMRPSPLVLMVGWLTPLVFALTALGLVAISYVPGIGRKFMRWIPGFNESVLARVGHGSSLLIRKGVPLPEALDLLGSLESGNYRMAIERWAADVRRGVKTFENTPSGKSLPGLFLSFIKNSGENLEVGFSEAGAFYERRAKYKIEMGLYCFLPIVTLFLSLLVWAQAAGLFQSIIVMLDKIGGSD
jgi:type II secretory pathway component PulF